MGTTVLVKIMILLNIHKNYLTSLEIIILNQIYYSGYNWITRRLSDLHNKKFITPYLTESC